MKSWRRWGMFHRGRDVWAGLWSRSRSLPGRKGEEDHSRLELAQTDARVTTECTVHTRIPVKGGAIHCYAGTASRSWTVPGKARRRTPPSQSTGRPACREHLGNRAIGVWDGGGGRDQDGRWVHSFPLAAGLLVTKYNTLNCLSNRNFSSHSLGDQKSEIRLLAVPCSLSRS